MGTMTINTTAQDDARLVVAFGRYLNLKDENGDPRNATAAEIKQFVIRQVRNVVITEERKIAVAAITDTPIDPT